MQITPVASNGSSGLLGRRGSACAASLELAGDEPRGAGCHQQSGERAEDDERKGNRIRAVGADPEDLSERAAVRAAATTARSRIVAPTVARACGREAAVVVASQRLLARIRDLVEGVGVGDDVVGDVRERLVVAADRILLVQARVVRPVIENLAPAWFRRRRGAGGREREQEQARGYDEATCEPQASICSELNGGTSPRLTPGSMKRVRDACLSGM
jgi:hypothetical protein